jgi:hypothetical protein
MASFSKEFHSGTPGNGRSVKVAATATAGTLIHTAHATAKDEIYLYAVNTDTVPRKLTIEWGGTTAPDDLIEITIPPESGPICVIPGWVLSGGLVVRAFAAAANVIVINGFVNRIT